MSIYLWNSRPNRIQKNFLLAERPIKSALVIRQIKYRYNPHMSHTYEEGASKLPLKIYFRSHKSNTYRITKFDIKLLHSSLYSPVHPTIRVIRGLPEEAWPPPPPVKSGREHCFQTCGALFCRDVKQKLDFHHVFMPLQMDGNLVHRYSGIICLCGLFLI